MSALEELKNRAATAEQQLAAMKTELARLQQQVDAKTSSSNGSTASQPQAKKAKKPAEKIELPMALIEDEAILISEKGKDATMTVTICNGESNPPFISAKGINYLKSNFVTNEKDIFVDTYAKCGTTLCIKLVFQIYQAAGRVCDGARAKDMSSPWDAVPWIEVDVSQQLVTEKSDSPSKFLEYVKDSNGRENNVRIWKSHAPYVNFPAKEIGQGSKIIHVTRNPKDVVCSYFNFFQKEPFVAYQGDFNTLFDWFCDGSVVHSNFWDFELAWYRAAQQNESQILWITFEEIVRIPHVTIRRVAKFLDIDLNDEQTQHIANEISFEKMKNDALKNAGNIASVLMNKGTIGRWQKVLSKEQSARMDRISNCRFAGTGIEYDYGDDEQAAKAFYSKRAGACINSVSG